VKFAATGQNGLTDVERLRTAGRAPAPAMIRDVSEFRRSGVAGRLVSELDVPVAVWRAAMCHAGRHDGVRVRTFLVPLNLLGPDDSPRQMVFAVRTDPPPDPAAQKLGLLHWWRVDDLNMPFDRWRAALHHEARPGNVRVKTFLVPPSSAAGVDTSDQLVYVVWADSTDPRCTTHVAPVGPVSDADPTTRPVTDLADYRADRLGRAGSIACHPSNFRDHGNRHDDDDDDTDQ
jgi:hypothetical protein